MRKNNTARPSSTNTLDGTHASLEIFCPGGCGRRIDRFPCRRCLRPGSGSHYGAVRSRRAIARRNRPAPRSHRQRPTPCAPQQRHPKSFGPRGMEFNPAVNNLRMQLQRRPDGTAVLRLSSDRPVNDPFVDLVLDATWGSGHIVRSYTMLFDPPALRRAAPTVTAAPQISVPSAKARAGAAPRVSAAPASTPPRNIPCRQPAHRSCRWRHRTAGRYGWPPGQRLPPLPACRWTRCWWH